MPNDEGKFKAPKEVKNTEGCDTKTQNYQKTGNIFASTKAKIGDTAIAAYQISSLDLFILTRYCPTNC